MKELSQDAKAELESLSEECLKFGREVQPEDVLDWATDPKTALHKFFEWNDTEAAEKYRTLQAKKILQVWVEVVETKNEPTHVTVGMKPDTVRRAVRKREPAPETVSRPGFQQLVADAIEELKFWRNRYASLKTVPGGTPLEAVFSEVDRLIPTGNGVVEEVFAKPPAPGSVEAIEMLRQKFEAGASLFDGGIPDDDESDEEDMPNRLFTRAG